MLKICMLIAVSWLILGSEIEFYAGMTRIASCIQLIGCCGIPLGSNSLGWSELFVSHELICTERNPRD